MLIQAHRRRRVIQETALAEVKETFIWLFTQPIHLIVPFAFESDQGSGVRPKVNNFEILGDVIRKQ
jgi:hypothetical protein